MALSSHSRNLIKKQLQSKEFDLVIIGGGINGAGVARDAVSRGMSVALVEAQDFAEGTSSRSSKLIHGGIRYLENLEFHLVFEALSERRRLFEIAPHLVHPLRFVLPVYDDSRVGMFKMGLGMWLYDALAMFEAPEMHERLSARQVYQRYPEIQPHYLKGAYVYSDAYTDDDRLVIETLRDADRRGAHCINYVKATGAQLLDNKICAVEVKDQVNGEEFAIKAKHVVSTVGPWTDILAGRIFGSWDSILRPTKGVHLTFSRSRVKLNDAVVMADDKNNRIVFAIPRHEMVIIGTTDTDYTGDPADVKVEQEDIDYLLKIADEYFPGAKLTEKDIISAYAGIRPLVADGSSSEGKTSREHTIIKDHRNVTFVAGGKYTTYRIIAKETVDAALDSFPLNKRMNFSDSKTLEPLNPKATLESIQEAKVKSIDWPKLTRLPKKLVGWLIERHAGEAEHLLRSYYRLSDQPIAENRLWMMEAKFAIKETMCMSLIDFYVRRTPLFLSEPDHGLQYVRDVVQVFADEFNWSLDEIREQVAALRAFIAKETFWKNSEEMNVHSDTSSEIRA